MPLDRHGAGALLESSEMQICPESSPAAPVFRGIAGYLNCISIEKQKASFATPGMHLDLGSEATGKISGQVGRLIEILPSIENLLAKNVTIAVKSRGNILFVDSSQIAFVEAQVNHVLLQGPTESHLLRESLSAVAHKLKACGFVRIHRSTLVNATHVQGFRSKANRLGEHVLYLKGGKELTVSRTYKKNVEALAQFWLGMNGR